MSIRIKMFLGFVVIAVLCFFFGFSLGRPGAGGMVLPIATAAAALILAFVFTRVFAGRIRWCECILDAIPFPVSATDMNRRWTFVNAAVEGMLKKMRGQLAGQPCSNWGAGICNTENCGINCLNRGESMTFFSQGGMDFKVYIAYLKNSAGRRIGHVEIVEDMTELFARQKADAAMAESISRMIVELSDHVSDVATKTAANAEQASRAASLTGSMKENADKGGEQMKHMISAVQEIKESAQTINKVINTINEIAFQTNLLALNASVEAARAGEAGKGFAVVADEVRNLAIRSAQAANDTNSIIRTSIEKSELGFRIAGETAASLADILDGLTNANRIVTGIAASSGEQSLAIQNINSSVQQMTNVTDKFALDDEDARFGVRIQNHTEAFS